MAKSVYDIIKIYPLIESLSKGLPKINTKKIVDSLNRKKGTAEKILKDVDDIEIVRFSQKDVVRHKLVQDIIKAYEKYESEEKKQ